MYILTVVILYIERLVFYYEALSFFCPCNNDVFFYWFRQCFCKRNKTSTSLTTTSSTNSSYIRATVQWNSISNAYLYDVNVRNLTDGYLYQAYQFSASTTSFTTAHLEEGKMFEISVYARDKERQNQIAKGKAIFTSHEGLNFTNINISLQ